MEKLTKLLAYPLFTALLAGAAHAQDAQPAQQTLRIVGASTAVLPVQDAADILRKEQNLILQITPVMNSNAQKVQAMGEDATDIALIARPLSAVERAPYPDIDFQEIQFGEEAAVMAVSRDVWDGGVHALTRDQARRIYEGKIKNWKEVGGPDLPVAGYTPDSGRGIWSCYVQWLYDDPAEIPDNRFPQTKTDDEAKAYLESTAGSITQVAMLYAVANHLHALAIKNDDGKVIQPSAATVADHSYPVARPLIMVVKGRPLGDTVTFLKFMVGDEGQKLVHKYNYLTLKELGIEAPSF
jgi:phosphate transport system substrate-binding protein